MADENFPMESPLYPPETGKPAGQHTYFRVYLETICKIAGPHHRGNRDKITVIHTVSVGNTRGGDFVIKLADPWPERWTDGSLNLT
jgi:hypothetical protein